jgi:hypothetical protein
LMQSQDIFSKLAALGGAALGAAANVSFAFILGVEEAYHLHCQELEKHDFYEALDRIRSSAEEQEVVNHNEVQRQTMKAAQDCLEVIQRQVKRQKKIVSDRCSRSRWEYTRWEKSMREAIGQGSQVAQSDVAVSNGHRLPPSSDRYIDLTFEKFK